MSQRALDLKVSLDKRPKLKKNGHEFLLNSNNNENDNVKVAVLLCLLAGLNFAP
jgi:hypothetical protein